jgi:hypothetical protein
VFVLSEAFGVKAEITSGDGKDYSMCYVGPATPGPSQCLERQEAKQRHRITIGRIYRKSGTAKEESNSFYPFPPQRKFVSAISLTHLTPKKQKVWDTKQLY